MPGIYLICVHIQSVTIYVFMCANGNKTIFSPNTCIVLTMDKMEVIFAAYCPECDRKTTSKRRPYSFAETHSRLSNKLRFMLSVILYNLFRGPYFQWKLIDKLKKYSR